MKDAGGARPTVNVAKRKLENADYIKAHSGLINDHLRIGRMKRASMLVRLMSHISRVEKKILQKRRNPTSVNYLQWERVLEAMLFRKKETQAS